MSYKTIKRIVQEEYGGWVFYDSDRSGIYVGHSAQPGELGITVNDDAKTVSLEAADEDVRTAIMRRIQGETVYRMVMRVRP